MDVTSTILSHITVAEKVYNDGKWVTQNIAPWRPPAGTGNVDDQLKIDGAEYYRLQTETDAWRTFDLGKEKFREENRLTHNRQQLIGAYPGLAGQLLADQRVSAMPYQIVSEAIAELKLAVRETQYQTPAELSSIYEVTRSGLVEHYKRAGITYEPAQLARIAGAGDALTLEQTNYTDAASTNLIADLNLANALGKRLLMENTGTARTIREYDSSLAENPGCLPAFHRSALANPLGVAGIGLTADNRLVLSHRSRSVSTYAGRLAPSASGYISWQDVTSQPGASLNTVLQLALAREISEELHLNPTRDLSNLHPLGLYREFYRAGMPQAFYAFKLRLTADELIERITSSHSHAEFKGLLFIPVDRQVLAKAIATLVRAERIKDWEVGLEAQGLLTALARRGENFFFPG